MIKKIIRIIIFPFEVTAKGFYNLCLLLSRGFYFYFYCFFDLLSKIFKSNIFNKIKSIFKKLQNNPVSFLILVVLFFGYIFFARYGYASNDVKVYVDDDDSVVENSDDSKANDSRVITNLYNKYGSYKTSDIDISELKKINKDTVAWIVVDGTNINYPIVLGNDNDYYLSHDFNKDYSIGGWIFMDYRNAPLMEDKNTIIYGHNTQGTTMFATLRYVLQESWYTNPDNQTIIFNTPSAQYVAKIFSIYVIDNTNDYLYINFSDADYINFINMIKGRSIYDFGVDVTTDDKMITLSTCNNTGDKRLVVHAKLIQN